MELKVRFKILIKDICNIFQIISQRNHISMNKKNHKACGFYFLLRWVMWTLRGKRTAKNLFPTWIFSSFLFNYEKNWCKTFRILEYYLLEPLNSWLRVTNDKVGNVTDFISKNWCDLWLFSEERRLKGEKDSKLDKIKAD